MRGMRASHAMGEVVGYFDYYSPAGDVAVRVITTVAKAALLVDNGVWRQI